MSPVFVFLMFCSFVAWIGVTSSFYLILGLESIDGDRQWRGWVRELAADPLIVLLYLLGSAVVLAPGAVCGAILARPLLRRGGRDVSRGQTGGGWQE